MAILWAFVKDPGTKILGKLSYKSLWEVLVGTPGEMLPGAFLHDLVY